LILPFASIGLVVLIVSLIIMHLPLPEISEEEPGHGHGIVETSTTEKPTFHKPLFRQRHFVMGVISQFCYVAAQTGIFSYLINFVTDKKQNHRFNFENGLYFFSIDFPMFIFFL